MKTEYTEFLHRRKGDNKMAKDKSTKGLDGHIYVIKYDVQGNPVLQEQSGGN